MFFHFKPLHGDDFGLLLKWLESPHVKAWWDQDIQWTPRLIEEKYGSYIHGYKDDGGVHKPLSAYIITIDSKPVGYIQLYDAYDFPREDAFLLEGLPKSLAAIDYFIGDANSIGKGIGSKALKMFLEKHVFPNYEACLVDPDSTNFAAIKSYEKAGFKKVKQVQESKVIWMINIHK